MPRPRNTCRAAASAARRRPAIDLNGYVPTRIAILANRLSRAASRFYRERYGIGVVEWRVMTFVGYANDTSANRICSATDLDKGAVSRSLNLLARMGIVSVKQAAADSRRHHVTLTAKGRALHDRIVPVALERQRELLSVLSPAEAEAFKEMIDRMQASVAGGSGAGKKRPSAVCLARAPRRDEAPRRHASAPRG